MIAGYERGAFRPVKNQDVAKRDHGSRPALHVEGSRLWH